MEIAFNIVTLVIAIISLSVSLTAMTIRKSSMSTSIQAQISDRNKFIHEMIVSKNTRASSKASRMSAYQELFNVYEMACHKYYANQINQQDFIDLSGKEIIRIVERNKYDLLTKENYPYILRLSQELSIKKKNDTEVDHRQLASIIYLLLSLTLALSLLGYCLSN